MASIRRSQHRWVPVSTASSERGVNNHGQETEKEQSEQEEPPIEHNADLFAILRFPVSVAGECTQHAGLLLKIVNAKIQHVADADHANQATFLDDWHMANIARHHRRCHIRYLVAGGTRDDGCGHEGRDGKRVKSSLMDAQPVSDIALRNHAVHALPVLAHDGSADQLLPKR